MIPFINVTEIMQPSYTEYKTLAQQQAEKKANDDKWDRRFLDLARHYAGWSKEVTKVGAVLVKKDRSVISSGYNGMPRGVRDDVPTRLERPEKYYWSEHAERNAIYQSAKIGVPLSGSTLYSTLCPCMDCARAIVQSGIRRIVCPVSIETQNPEKWQEHFFRTKELFQECSVRLDFID